MSDFQWVSTCTAEGRARAERLRKAGYKSSQSGPTMFLFWRDDR